MVRLDPPATPGPGRTLIVDDDLSQIERVALAVDAPVLGYLCPSIVATVREHEAREAVADGGVALEYAEADADRGTGSLDAMHLDRPGGLSRLEDVLVEYDVNTVVLAFREADWAEFFGALDACHEHGVSAKVHRDYADSVLVSEADVGELVEVDLQPWDPVDHLGSDYSISRSQRSGCSCSRR